MKVTVTQGIRVVHDGTVYQDSESADVPESVAAFWLECGWAGEESLRDPRGLTAGPLKTVEPEDEPTTPAPEIREPQTAPRTTRAGRKTGAK